MSSFLEFRDALESALTKYAQRASCQSQALADGKQFIYGANDDLAKWTGQLSSGKITKAEFEWNLKSAVGLAELVALKQAGMAQINLDKFISGLIDLIVNTAASTFL